jgi:Chlorophyll A-B binding protein
MKTAAFLAFLAGSAAAFAPSSTVRPSLTKVAAASFDTDPGRANDVLGMWDPLNLVKGEQKNFDRLRASEIKNGRVAMLGECVCVFLV